MSEWKELKTLQEVAAAQARGDEIQYDPITGNWHDWVGTDWHDYWKFRSRPRKKTKTIVLREALFKDGTGRYWTSWYNDGAVERYATFVRWLDTPAREVEVPDE